MLKKDVSIIIVNHNTCNLAAKCIHSIFEKTKSVSFEVILVDNASTDDSKIYFSAEPRITYIYSDENLGFGRANNKGLSVACGRNILFLNPDTLLINDAVGILSNYLDGHNEAGACGGNLFNEAMHPTHSFQRLLPSIVYELNLCLSRLPEKWLCPHSCNFNYTNREIAVPHITGADLMVKKQLLDQIGAFAEEFFMYYEETDLCCRIKKTYAKIISVPSAKIQHLEGRSFGPNCLVNENRLRLQEESRMIYYRKHYSHAYINIVNAIYWITLTVRILIFGKKSHKGNYYFLRKQYHLQAIHG